MGGATRGPTGCGDAAAFVVKCRPIDIPAMVGAGHNAAMTTEWAVTTGTERVALDAARSADVIFTVTNNGPVNGRAMLDAVGSESTDTSWFIVEEPQRMISAGASMPYRVKITVPPGAPAGTHFLHARVYSADAAPEETSRLSNRIGFDVAGAAAKPKPWWLIGVAALVAVVLGVVGWLVFRPGPAESEAAPPSPSPSRTSVPVPNLVGMQQSEASSALQQAGLTVGTVRHRHAPDQSGQVTEQSVPQGSEAGLGTTVDLVVNVSLAAPVLTSPGGGALFVKEFPALAWQPVEGAAKYRVRVDTEMCVFLIFAVECRYFDDPQLGSPYGDYHTTSVIEVSATTVRPDIVLKVQPDVPKAGHSGNVRWQVVAVDDFGTAGPPSGFLSFFVNIR